MDRWMDPPPDGVQLHFKDCCEGIFEWVSISWERDFCNSYSPKARECVIGTAMGQKALRCIGL